MADIPLDRQSRQDSTICPSQKYIALASIFVDDHDPDLQKKSWRNASQPVCNLKP
jgi:hypothetical protein